MTIELRSVSTEETRAAGRRLAGLLRPGDLVLLCGELGSGKTVFAAGIGEALGIEEALTSPTFILVRRYEDGFIPLVHVDVYRLGTTGEFDDLDLLDSPRDAVMLVEWGDAVASVLSNDHLRVDLVVEDDDERLIRFRPSGAWCRRPLQELEP